MVELVVVSGKGGTGKTSLVGALAALSRNKVMVDCDVDAADLHLILRNEVLRSSEFTGGRRAAIIAESCTGCGECQPYCRFDAIRAEPSPEDAGTEKYRIDPYACDGCGVCVRHCPESAIDFSEIISGEWSDSETPYGPLLHARLGLAQANSGKLVSLLRQQARQKAAEKGFDLVLIDGPPGIGCPVIASITGSHYVLIVTEPSMSALHDMERLLQLTRHFRIPTGICINKADINPEITARITDFAASQGLEILGQIPFDPAVTAAQLSRGTVVEQSAGPAAAAIRRLWEKLVPAMEPKKDNPSLNIITKIHKEDRQ